MYIYDIKLPNKDQYSLHIKFSEKNISPPLNVSKKLYYLKEKIQSHRCISDISQETTYVILDCKNNEVYSYTFAAGDSGKTTKPYFTVKSKPVLNYKPVYLYKNSDVLTDVIRENEFYLTYYDVICDEGDNIITDLNFLKYLSDRLFYGRARVMVSKKLLVQIATYFPTSKEEFISLSGAGEKVYEYFGIEVVEYIRANYFNKKE